MLKVLCNQGESPDYFLIHSGNPACLGIVAGTCGPTVFVLRRKGTVAVVRGFLGGGGGGQGGGFRGGGCGCLGGGSGCRRRGAFRGHGVQGLAVAASAAGHQKSGKDQNSNGYGNGFHFHSSK